MNATPAYDKPAMAAEALSHIAEILKSQRPKEDVMIEYVMMDDNRIRDFSDFDIQRFGLLSRDEYVLIHKLEEYDGQYHLLYSMNVSALSVLAIAAETMDLISRKF